MGSSGLEPVAGVFDGYAPAQLEPVRINTKRLPCLLLVSGSEHNDMPAGKPIPFVEIRIPRCGAIRDKIRLQASAVIAKRASHDLFHFSLMQVYAGSKHVNQSNAEETS